jgi:hypothetical protein
VSLANRDQDAREQVSGIKGQRSSFASTGQTVGPICFGLLLTFDQATKLQTHRDLGDGTFFFSLFPGRKARLQRQSEKQKKERRRRSRSLASMHMMSTHYKSPLIRPTLRAIPHLLLSTIFSSRKRLARLASCSYTLSNLIMAGPTCSSRCCSKQIVCLLTSW